MKITAGELAALVHGTLEGDPNTIITHPSKIEEAVDGSLCYLDNLQYEPYLYQTKASAVLVNSGFQAKSPVKPVMIRVENVRLTVSELFKKFQDFTENSGIDPKAEIHSSVVLGEMVSVGAFTNISESAQIGAKTYIHPQVFIGKNVQIGESVIIYPGVRIYKDCIIGNRCIIHSNAVIGSDGFGFAPDANGVYQKIAQLGNVVLGNDVEIGSNTTIDRGTMGSTKIGDGCKLDNLIQIAHNVQIGNHTVIAAQAGIALTIFQPKPGIFPHRNPGTTARLWCRCPDQ